MCPRLRVPKFTALLAMVWLALAAMRATEPLRLVAVLDGHPHERLVVGKRGVEVPAANGPMVLPNSADWRIEGEVAANARFFRLSPVYSLERVSGRRSPFAATSGFSHSAQIQFRYAPDDLPPWSAKSLERALVVFAWIQGGRVVRAAGIPVSRSLNPEDALARITFLMDETDARGFPAVLLWKDGAFIAPAPMFRDPAGEAWLQAVHFPASAGEVPAASPAIAKLRGTRGITPMQIVAESGLAPAVSRLLEAAPAAYIRSAANDTALRWAASNGRTDAIRVLISAGARLNESGWGSLPLNYSVKRRHDDTAAFLVEAGAQFDVSLDGHTTASMALDLGLPRTLTAIAAKGGIAPLRDRLNARLANAVVRDPLELIVALLALGADARSRVNGTPLLAFAAQRPGAAPIIGALLRAGADPAQTDPAGVAPLSVAVRSGELANARALLAAGASTTQADRHGRIALHYAAAGTDPAIVPLLVGAGAPLTSLDEGGSSPLAIAVARQSAPMIAALVASGARIDLRSAEAPHLLAQAVLLDQLELLQRAAEDGWDSGAIAGNTWSPATLGRVAGVLRVTDWLERHGRSGGDLPRLEAGDAPPRPAHTPVPADPRVEDALFPESTVAITAIVEANGSLSHVIARSPHDRLRTATLAAVRTWRFAPATKAGVPKAIPITFPVQFPVRDNRLFALSDVEREPVLARSGSLMEELSRRMDAGGLRWHGATEVGFVVERDGSTSRISLLEGLPEDFAAIIREVVASAKFKPAQREGKPVRSWIEVTTGYSLNVVYVRDETRRLLPPPEDEPQ
jgi:ankyrin repeat protein